MPEYTNISNGTRVVSFGQGKTLKHVAIAPGETIEIERLDDSHPAIKGLLENREIIMGRPDDPAPKGRAELAALKRRIADLEAELAQTKEIAETDRAEGTRRIADLEAELSNAGKGAK